MQDYELTLCTLDGESIATVQATHFNELANLVAGLTGRGEAGDVIRAVGERCPDHSDESFTAAGFCFVLHAPGRHWPVVAVSDRYGSQYLPDEECAPDGAVCRSMTVDEVRSWVSDGDAPEWVRDLPCASE